MIAGLSPSGVTVVDIFFIFLQLSGMRWDEMCVFCSIDEAEMERWRRGSGGGEFLRLS